MFGAEDKQNIGISLHPFCSWPFFWVAMPCAGLSLKTHCMSSAKPMNINGELMVIDAGSTWNGLQSSCVWGNVRIRLDAIPWTFWAFSNVCVVLKWKEVCLSKLRHLQTTYFETHSWGTPRRQLNHKSQESRGAVKLFFFVDEGSILIAHSQMLCLARCMCILKFHCKRNVRSYGHFSKTVYPCLPGCQPGRGLQHTC